MGQLQIFKSSQSGEEAAMSSDEEEEYLQLTTSGHIKIQSHEGVTTRLEVYSDAIFSIISTISILPAIEELRDGGSFEDILDYIFLYIVSYQFIVLYYREHNFKFNRLMHDWIFIILIK